MTIMKIPFMLNRKQGTLIVEYKPNQSIIESGFDLLAGLGFDVNMAIGYPTMRGVVSAYEGTGYYTASAWIQIITRREFDRVDSKKPAKIITSVDVNDTLFDLGVPFFAMGFPAEIYDAPCCNLGEAEKLAWIADTFFVTMPSRINNNTIGRIAGYQWGYIEYDQDEKRNVEILPLKVTDESHWQEHLPLLRGQFGGWKYA
jgi:hypothetical protein